MDAPFPGDFLDRPRALDVSASGRFAVLDGGGRRLCLVRPGEPPETVALDLAAARVRFRGEDLVLLGEGQLRSLRPDGETVGGLALRPGAVDVAVLRSGAVIVAYGRQEHGIAFERIAPTPLVRTEPGLRAATCLAVESGAFWVAGTGTEAPAARALRYRPAPDGVSLRETVALPAPARAATIGPDGALYLLLEPGAALLRVFGAAAGAPAALPDPLSDLARAPQRLLGCGPRGLADLTRFVPPPGDRPPPPDLPSCA